MLKGKHVVLGITGSIAAYKTAGLASMLVKKGCHVHVLMTENATNFINPITFETLTGNKCLVDTFDRNFEFSVEHVALAKQADVVMIAPASANSIAKLAHLYKQQGKRVMLAAGDTFRAAAAEQLCVWAERADVPVVKHNEGADPAAVLFDAVQSAAARGYDMVICDTAGRLHNKKNLMDELSKISRVVHKACGTASVETLLVLDAITGQNAISQASQFIDAAGATGIVLTKLDGTAKGGAVISIKAKLGLPVRFVGVGEGMDDLMEFDPDAFVDALFLREE